MTSNIEPKDMQMDSNDKYKMFRNFMVNELGIGRDDLRAWTIEAVTREVDKLLGQINVQSLVSNTIDNRVRNAIRGSSYSGFSEAFLEVVHEAIASEISGRIAFKNPENKP